MAMVTQDQEHTSQLSLMYSSLFTYQSNQRRQIKLETQSLSFFEFDNYSAGQAAWNKFWQKASSIIQAVDAWTRKL